MKKRMDRYKRSQWLETAVIAILALECIGGLYKGYYMYEKISLVKSGFKLFNEGKWIEAEEKLTEATELTYYEYRQRKVENRLETLNWITEYNETLQEIYNNLCLSKENVDYELFQSTLSAYNTLDLSKLEPYQTEYFDEVYPIAKAKQEAWVQFKGKMQYILQNAKEEYLWAKEQIQQVPDTCFASDKKAAIAKLFEACDIKLFKNIASKEIALKDQMLEFNEIYETNNHYGYETEWLTEKIKQYIRDKVTARALPTDAARLNEIANCPKTTLRTLTEAGEETRTAFENFFNETKTQISTVVEVIEDYRKEDNSYYYDEGIEKIAEQYMSQKEADIQVLVNAQYYDEAISWYQAMGNLKDFSQEIQAIDNMKYFNDPVLLIENQINNYAFYEVGSGALGAEKYLAAINKSTSKLEIYRFNTHSELGQETKLTCSLKGTYLERPGALQEDNIINNEGNIPDNESNVLSNNGTIQMMANGDLLAILYFVEGGQNINVLRVGETEIQNIFARQGTNVIVTPDINSITINRRGDISDTYVWNGEGYIKQVPEVQMVTLAEINQNDYTGKLVKFPCYISDGTTTTPIGYENEWGALNIGIGTFLVADAPISPGYCWITGEVIGKEPYTFDGNWIGIEYPKIKVQIVEPIQ